MFSLKSFFLFIEQNLYARSLFSSASLDCAVFKVSLQEQRLPRVRPSEPRLRAKGGKPRKAYLSPLPQLNKFIKRRSGVILLKEQLFVFSYEFLLHYLFGFASFANVGFSKGSHTRNSSLPLHPNLGFSLLRCCPCSGGKIVANEVKTDARCLLIENYIQSPVYGLAMTSTVLGNFCTLFGATQHANTIESVFISTMSKQRSSLKSSHCSFFFFLSEPGLDGCPFVLKSAFFSTILRRMVSDFFELAHKGRSFSL